MEIEKIYNSEDGNQLIFCLENGRKIIKRDNGQVKKLNIKQWEDINFIPEHFQEVNRETTSEEKQQLKQYIKNNTGSNNTSFLKKLKNNIKNIFN